MTICTGKHCAEHLAPPKILDPWKSPELDKMEKPSAPVSSSDHINRQT